MIARVAIAAAGAIVVTAGLLLAMDAVTSLFEDQSDERYFRITDILPKPEQGRPDRPEARERQPELVEQNSAAGEAALPIEAPVVEGDSTDVLPPDIARPGLPED